VAGVRLAERESYFLARFEVEPIPSTNDHPAMFFPLRSAPCKVRSLHDDDVFGQCANKIPVGLT